MLLKDMNDRQHVALYLAAIAHARWRDIVARKDDSFVYRIALAANNCVTWDEVPQNISPEDLERLKESNRETWASRKGRIGEYHKGFVNACIGYNVF